MLLFRCLFCNNFGIHCFYHFHRLKQRRISLSLVFILPVNLHIRYRNNWKCLLLVRCKCFDNAIMDKNDKNRTQFAAKKCPRIVIKYQLLSHIVAFGVDPVILKTMNCGTQTLY